MRDRKKFAFTAIALVLVFIAAGSKSLAVENSEITAAAPEEKQIIVYEEHSFSEQSYDPPYEIQIPIDQEDMSAATPEDALIAYFSMLLQGDIDMSHERLSQSDKKAFNDKPAEQQEKEKSLLKDQVDKALKGSSVVFERKLTVGDSYVVIDYSVFKNDKKAMSWFAALVRENDNWAICRQCGATPDHPLNPVLHNFRFDGPEKVTSKIRIDARKDQKYFRLKFKEKQ